MTKQTLAAALLGILTVGLIACGSSGAPPAPPPPPSGTVVLEGEAAETFELVGTTAVPVVGETVVQVVLRVKKEISATTVKLAYKGQSGNEKVTQVTGSMQVGDHIEASLTLDSGSDKVVITGFAQ